MTVPAWVMKTRARDHSRSSTARSAGTLYGGNSRIIVEPLPERRLRWKIQANKNIPTVPSAYSPSMKATFVHTPPTPPGSSTPIIITYTGSRAEQLASGATRMVMSRSRGFAMVRVAMIPGIAQAYELSSGIKARPFSPTRLINRSMMNATRAM